MDDIEDEWAYKANKKDKNQKKKLKGGAARGHEKIIDDMHKAYNEKKAKEKQLLLEKEAKKKADYEKKKEAKQEEQRKAAERVSKKQAKR